MSAHLGHEKPTPQLGEAPANSRAGAVKPTLDVEPTYIPKYKIHEKSSRASDLASALLIDIAQQSNLKRDDTDQIAKNVPPTGHANVAIFTKVDGVVGVRHSNSSLQTPTGSKLLSPVRFAASDLVITGIPSSTDEPPEIISDGNFLSAI